MNINIIELSERLDLMDKAVEYFWTCWGSDSNRIFYKDCIEHSVSAENALPKFFVVLENNEIIASYALLVNDIISRQDLVPWFACLFVNETHRKQGIAEQLLTHALEQAKLKGYDTLYLSSDLENFYERKGWTYFGDGYNVFGDLNRMFKKTM